MYALSLFLSIMTFFTLWLMIPVFIFPPLAFYVGYKAYQAHRRRPGPYSRSGMLVSMIPMAVAVAVFVLAFIIINIGYNA
jgi:hypothetical protein